jgi:hypothetical protein
MSGTGKRRKSKTKDLFQFGHHFSGIVRASQRKRDGRNIPIIK